MGAALESGFIQGEIARVAEARAKTSPQAARS